MKLTEQRPLNERPAAVPKPKIEIAEPISPELERKQKRIGALIGLGAALVVVGIPIAIVVSIIAGNNAKEVENQAFFEQMQQQVQAQKTEASQKCFEDISNWRGEPLAGNKVVDTYEVRSGTVKIQGVALGGQFTCIYTDDADISKKKIKQLSWDRMDGSAPDFYIP